MEILGRIKMTRFCAEILCDVTKASIRLDKDCCAFVIDETSNTTGDPDEIVIDPCMEAFYFGKDIDTQRLLGGETISIPLGYDEKLGTHVATFNFGDHNDLNENVIQILEVLPDKVLVKWTATTQDPNFYDGSKPDTIIECETWMTREIPTS